MLNYVCVYVYVCMCMYACMCVYVCVCLGICHVTVHACTITQKTGNRQKTI